ncbi:MAG: AMP-binding protein, partial [Acidimicrobiia bacterium]
MRVPLTIIDHIRRAELLYPDRVAVVDEPDQPAPSWGTLTYREMAERARAQAAGLDALGIEAGERVAVVSHNSARLLTSFFGVSGSGRILVPVNFRLVAEEVKYIVRHSGARVLLVDPELEEAMSSVECEHKFVIGSSSDDALMRFDASPRPWVPDEDATATINYTSGTTARPKGVQLTHRNLWLNSATFGWQMGVNDRDVYLHTLPQFHCNGWGMVYAVTGMGGTHVVLRKVDGGERLRRIERHAVTRLCGAPAVVNAILDAAATWDGPIPGRDRVRMVVAGAPPPTRTIERMETELGWEFVQLYGLTETSPFLTMNRTRSEFDHLSPAERAQKLSRAGSPALGVELRISPQGEVLARGNVIMEGYWNQPESTADAIHAASDDPDGVSWFHTGDGGTLDDDHYVTISDR